MNRADPAALERAQRLLAEKFAPWVQALELTVEALDPVVLRLANRELLARVGGILCGQAIMAAADTAMVVAVAHQLGGFTEMATVSMTTHFLAPLVGEDGQVTLRLRKVGRSMAFGDAELTGAASGKLCAQAAIVYALAPRKPPAS